MWAVATMVAALESSPIRSYRIRGREYRVKRDDLFSAYGVSGNKARKLLSLAGSPPAGPVASMGGHQSNAMVAIASLCELYYFCKPVPRWLRENPRGNYQRALALGTKMIELQPGEDPRVIAAELGATWIPQGAAYPGAEKGLKILADELDGDVVVPAGTGTTALFLARHLKNATVYAVPCATPAAGLRAQMEHLDARTGSVGRFPVILDSPRPFRFGAPNERDIAVWLELRAAGLPVDLVYAPHTWDVLLHHGLGAVYVHTGGLEGVETQLARYKRANLLPSDSALLL
ncbi:hypothetical protein CTAYLR_009980 [Chrysophaeum taylorii]|uniref:1-aminocyclopropane-1-carboxylate deaminase n=1 Tax=Chrysophaeum taylorii TaxID=2483200 RepID=A0AAD7XKS7_9STRA|nr:hypothetical protein CTAYLR_009980 [Chrysophaeum taylorii]